MFTEYVEKAMHHAEYEQMEDGNWWGQVTELKFTWPLLQHWKNANRNCVTKLKTGWCSLCRATVQSPRSTASPSPSHRPSNAALWTNQATGPHCKH